MQPGGLAGVHRLALKNAAEAYEAGRADQAAEWIARVPVEMRPARLAGAVRYALARRAISEQEWSRAMIEMESAVRADPREGHYQQRLALLRRRQPLMSDRQWHMMDAAIDAAKRLPPSAFMPEIAAVYACGAYFSRGSGRAAPWTRLLSQSKSPVPDPGERVAILRLAAGYFCRFLAEQTTLLAVAEVVVPIPADPDRYLARIGFSLPDELARAVQSQLSIPAALLAIQRTGSDVEMKKLSSTSERRAAANQAYEPGPDRSIADGRCVLLVDDVITSGSTLRAAARVVRDAGAKTVIAAALSHTEGELVTQVAHPRPGRPPEPSSGQRWRQRPSGRGWQS